MRKITLDEAALLLKEHDNYEILTHRYPDGDTVGSAFALCYALRALGKNANVLTDSKLVSKFGYLAKNYKKADFEPMYIISVDVAAKSLLGSLEEKYGDIIDLCIDHHPSNSIVASDIYVDSTAAATAEIIFDLINLLDTPISRDIANCLYTGISTDTGCFCYTNTTPKTHSIASVLMAQECDWQKINRVNFETKTRAKLKMERMVYDTMEFYAGGQCAIVYTTVAMQNALCAGDDEMEGLASIPRQIEGVKMGVTMREKEDGTFKISVRTNDGIDASAFCSQFGGGGHAAAAGCSIKGDLASVKRTIIDAVEKAL